MVEGPHCHEAVVFLEVDEDLGFGAEFLDGVDDVGADGVVGELVVGAGCVDGGADLADDDLHAFGEAWSVGGLIWGGGGLDGFDGGLDGAAAGVSHDDDEAWPELEGGELDGAELEGGDDVAGDADDEHVSDALVEEDFGGDAGV